jgi:hypothetical protein
MSCHRLLSDTYFLIRPTTLNWKKANKMWKIKSIILIAVLLHIHHDNKRMSSEPQPTKIKNAVQKLGGKYVPVFFSCLLLFG